MGKALGSWSGMRKYLEQEMLADSLRGRVRYGCTSYTGMDNCRIFEVCIDGRQVKRFSWETVNSYFISHGYSGTEKPFGVSGYWQDFWSNMEKYPMNSRTEYTDGEFCNALKAYRNSDIQSSIRSSDPLVRMLAVLDRRLGKRSLERLKDEISSQPEWLRIFYELRLDSENKG